MFSLLLVPIFFPESMAHQLAIGQRSASSSEFRDAMRLRYVISAVCAVRGTPKQQSTLNPNSSALQFQAMEQGVQSARMDTWVESHTLSKKGLNYSLGTNVPTILLDINTTIFTHGTGSKTHLNQTNVARPRKPMEIFMDPKIALHTLGEQRSKS